jgi:hypothetical protein
MSALATSEAAVAALSEEISVRATIAQGATRGA